VVYNNIITITITISNNNIIKGNWYQTQGAKKPDWLGRAS
jgi:hypothetical protein